MRKDRSGTGTGAPAPGATQGMPASDPADDLGGAPAEAIVRRTPDGWRVGGDEVPDLTCAMVLADLLAAELPTDTEPAIPADPPKPAADPAAKSASGSPKAPRPAPGSAKRTKPADGTSVAEEAQRLRTTVGQLEHALTARVRIEQAIGVLAERHRIRPRQAFEQLRSAARSRGRRVIDIAADVVASATNPLLQLPDELSRPRSGSRHAARHARGALGQGQPS
jgi:ANTAR domain